MVIIIVHSQNVTQKVLSEVDHVMLNLDVSFSPKYNTAELIFSLILLGGQKRDNNQRKDSFFNLKNLKLSLSFDFYSNSFSSYESASSPFHHD